MNDIDEDRKYEETETMRKRMKLLPCLKDNEGSRHRYSLQSGRINVTRGFILVYFGILRILGASGIWIANIMGRTQYSLNIPIVQNTYVNDIFLHICRYIHFVENSKIYSRNHPRWHPLVKVYLL